MDDPLKVKPPYENFKVKPGGLKKRKEERNRALLGLLAIREAGKRD